MTRTITRLYDSHTQALGAVNELEQAGIDRDRISILSSNADNWHDGSRGDGDNDTAEGAGKGATTGGILGAAGGLLAGLGMLAIPGLGPVVAAGWLASTAVGAAVGAAAGGAAGGLLGALKDAGHSDEDANVYAEGVRRGGSLVSVKAHDDETELVQRILDGRQGVDAATRGEAYRQAGWSAFDPQAPAYTADDIRRERSLYAEDRSFAGGVTDAAPEDEDDRAARADVLGRPSEPRREL